jgi:peptide/nickel transport system permease protein
LNLISYLLKRIIAAIPTLLAITTIVMALLVLGPGEPKIAGKTSALGEGEGPTEMVEGTGITIEQYRQKEIYGLNDPWYVQYGHWLLGNDLLGLREGPMVSTLPNGDKVTRYPRFGILRGDFGPSYTDLQPVPKKIWRAFRVTFFMSLISTVLTYIISIAIGVFSATHRGHPLDKLQTLMVFVLYSMPSFWVGTLLILFLTGGDHGVQWFPNAGLHSDGWRDMSFLSVSLDYLWHLALPIFVMTYGSFAFLSRYGRTAMLEVASADFVRTARAKGLSESRVVWGHIFRNALIPLVTLAANLLPALLGGSIVVERIFSIPGLGTLSLEAIINKDFTMIMAVTTLSSCLLVLGNLLADLCYCIADPRVSLEAQS